jgi:hypothetical protein
MIDAELLGEMEDVIRSMPPRETLRHDTRENHAWVGRAVAVILAWDAETGAEAREFARGLQSSNAARANHAIRQLLVLLHEGSALLRLVTVGPVNAAIGQGSIFDYFDMLRKLIETAQRDILFVDPYMDAEFVSKYLPCVRAGVSIRLLASRNLSSLVPAAQAFAQQARASVEVRSFDKMHDRYIIIDGATCYQSGASFKDGAKNAGTTITQITDAFDALKQTYEAIWSNATKRL